MRSRGRAFPSAAGPSRGRASTAHRGGRGSPSMRATPRRSRGASTSNNEPSGNLDAQSSEDSDDSDLLLPTTEPHDESSSPAPHPSDEGQGEGVMSSQMSAMQLLHRLNANHKRSFSTDFSDADVTEPSPKRTATPDSRRATPDSHRGGKEAKGAKVSPAPHNKSETRKKPAGKMKMGKPLDLARPYQGYPITSVPVAWGKAPKSVRALKPDFVNFFKVLLLDPSTTNITEADITAKRDTILKLLGALPRHQFHQDQQVVVQEAANTALITVQDKKKLNDFMQQARPFEELLQEFQTRTLRFAPYGVPYREESLSCGNANCPCRRLYHEPAMAILSNYQKDPKLASLPERTCAVGTYSDDDLYLQREVFAALGVKADGSYCIKYWVSKFTPHGTDTHREGLGRREFIIPYPGFEGLGADDGSLRMIYDSFRAAKLPMPATVLSFETFKQGLSELQDRGLPPLPRAVRTWQNGVPSFHAQGELIVETFYDDEFNLWASVLPPVQMHTRMIAAAPKARSQTSRSQDQPLGSSIQAGAVQTHGDAVSKSEEVVGPAETQEGGTLAHQPHSELPDMMDVEATIPENPE